MMAILESSALIAQIVAAIGVIWSILYLARQIKDSALIAKSSNHQQAADAHAGYLLGLVHDPEAAQLMLRGVRGEALREGEEFRFVLLLSSIFSQFQVGYFQNKSGLLPREFWEHLNRAMLFWLEYPGVRAWWQSETGRKMLRKDFSAHVDELIASSAP
jgi:hypothetical protein